MLTGGGGGGGNQLIIEPFPAKNIDMMFQASCHLALSVRYMFADYSVSFVSILIIKYSDYKNKENQENLHMLLCLECAYLSKSYLLSTVIYTMV